MATILTLSSLTSIQAQLVQAQRVVARDQAQVDADQSALEQSQRQLARDARSLDTLYDRRREAVGPPSAPAIDSVLRSQPIAATGTLQGTVNIDGQALGRLINVAA